MPTLLDRVEQRLRAAQYAVAFELMPSAVATQPPAGFERRSAWLIPASDVADWSAGAGLTRFVEVVANTSRVWACWSPAPSACTSGTPAASETHGSFGRLATVGSATSLPPNVARAALERQLKLLSADAMAGTTMIAMSAHATASHP